MNKTVSIIMLVLMAALFAAVVSADLTVTDVQFGDESQERDLNITKTITLTNPSTATSAVAFSGLTFTGVNGADVSQYKFLITAVGTVSAGSTSTLAVTNGVLSGSVSLIPGGSITLTLQAFVPKKFDSVDSVLQEVAQDIATTTVTNSGVAVVATGGKVTMQAKNKLTVSDMTVYVNGESQTVSNNERIENLKPGDKLRFEIVAKNQYSDRSNVDVAIDTAIVTIKSSSTELDVDDEEDLGTISPKSDDTATFDYTIPDDTNDGTYTVDVKVSGIDDFNGKHGEHTTIRLKVEREPHSITIRKALLQPSTIACDDTGRLITVDVNVNNMGQRNENEVVIEADSPQLKFKKQFSDIKLSKGKSKTQQFAIDVPQGTKPGAYRVDVNTYYANTVKSETKTLTLKVDACETQTTVVTPPASTVTPPAATVPQTTQPQATTVTPPKAKVTSTVSSFTDSDLYVYLLAGVSGVLLLLLFVMLVVLASRRRHDDD